jgi:hypothetical protein
LYHQRIGRTAFASPTKGRNPQGVKLSQEPRNGCIQARRVPQKWFQLYHAIVLRERRIREGIKYRGEKAVERIGQDTAAQRNRDRRHPAPWPVKCVHRKDKGQDKAGDSNGMFPTKVDFPLSVGLGDHRFYGGPTFGYFAATITPTIGLGFIPKRYGE